MYHTRLRVPPDYNIVLSYFKAISSRNDNAHVLSPRTALFVRPHYTFSLNFTNNESDLLSIKIKFSSPQWLIYSLSLQILSRLRNCLIIKWIIFSSSFQLPISLFRMSKISCRRHHMCHHYCNNNNEPSNIAIFEWILDRGVKSICRTWVRELAICILPRLKSLALQLAGNTVQLSWNWQRYPLEFHVFSFSINVAIMSNYYQWSGD